MLNLKRTSWLKSLFVAVPMTLLVMDGFAASSAPVAMLMQVKGTVEYSRDGQTWEKLNRNKLLFEGVQVRTGPDGSGSLVDQRSGTSRTMSAGTVVKVEVDGVRAVSGTLSDPQKAEGAMFASLENRFAEAQRYTTVRRSANKPDGATKEVKLVVAKKVALSNDYPELVWENVGPQYSYRLKLSNQTFDVPAVATGDIVRFKVPPHAPGTYEYSVEVVQNGQVIGTPAKKESSVQWLDTASYQSALDAVRQSSPNDAFMLASVLEEKGLIVAAMDNYRKHLASHPEDVELQPLLIRTYYDLKLKKLQQEAALKYNDVLGGGR
jgi:hypothetical protein